MKAAVAYLEPHMEKADAGGKGCMVIGTVKGDVHDIGKNLVDIILTNNGYEVHNIGIKAPLHDFIAKAEEVDADVIGMSGLLVKSTLIMRENLQEMNDQGLARIPVVLGGAALTRNYVERDLRGLYEGRLFYGKDAFEGLHMMDTLMEGKRTGTLDPDFGRAQGGRDLPPRKSEREAAAPRRRRRGHRRGRHQLRRRDRCQGVRAAVPRHACREGRVARRDRRLPQRDRAVPQPVAVPAAQGPNEKDDEFKARIRPTLRAELNKAKAEGWLVPAVAWGYFPVNAEGNDLVVWTDDARTTERLRFQFPRQRKDRHLCIADFFRSVESGEADYAGFHVVTMGSAATEREQELFAADRYQEYLLVHGLSVEMTEALAELWHRRIREEWGFADEDGPSLAGLFRQQYRGSRDSWATPRARTRRPGQARRAARPRQHRREAHRRVPARARAEHVRDHRPPSRGEVLHREQWSRVPHDFSARLSPPRVRPRLLSTRRRLSARARGRRSQSSWSSRRCCRRGRPHRPRTGTTWCPQTTSCSLRSRYSRSVVTRCSPARTPASTGVTRSGALRFARLGVLAVANSIGRTRCGRVCRSTRRRSAPSSWSPPGEVGGRWWHTRRCCSPCFASRSAR